MNVKLKNALKSPKWSNSFRIRICDRLREELQEWLKLDHLKMRHCFNKNLEQTETQFVVTYTDASSFALGIVIYSQNSVR